MISPLSPSSIRTRLLVVYMGILLLGFAALTLVAGGQISSSAQADYTQRLISEVSLIAQGIGPLVDNYVDGQSDNSQLDALLKQYEAQANGTLKLYTSADVGVFDGRDKLHQMIELETALRGQIIMVERKNEEGEYHFFTAAPVYHERRLYALVQLSVPTRNLQIIVNNRWLELGAVFALVAGLALAAALWLSRSIIRPLSKLRESASRLSKGEFSHRISYAGKDEIGDVAHAFNEMAHQVEGMLEEQRAFASNASHELRTPLTTIRLRTEALRFDETLDSTIAKTYVAEIDDEVARLGNLIQDLTLLSRFDAGRAALGRDQVDMLRFATSMQQQMAPHTREKNITLSISVPADLLPLNVSLNHLTVAFRNLLDNAIKYTPTGGTVNWAIVQANDGLRHTIRDSGRGITTEHLPRIFERFYRVDKARSRATPGTGLGLALVKSIVESYGGTIIVTSEGLDKGTTVTVFWPQQPPAKSVKR